MRCDAWRSAGSGATVQRGRDWLSVDSGRRRMRRVEWRAVAGDALQLLGAVAEQRPGGGSRSGSIQSSLDTAATQCWRASVRQSRDGCCEVDSSSSSGCTALRRIACGCTQAAELRC